MLRFVPLAAVVALLFFAGRARAQRIVINEIMYAPTSPEPEWVELYNSDSSHMQVITKWRVESGTKTVLPFAQIDPLGFLILTKDSSALRAKRPGSYPIIQVALPNLRNSGDTIYLRDSSGLTIDSVGYQSNWGGGNGKSLERIDALSSSTDQPNWATSKDSTGATAGRSNSAKLPAHDLALSVFPGDHGYVITLKNVGHEPISNPYVAQMTKADTITATIDTILLPRDSLKFSFLPKRTYYGWITGVIFCNDSLDENRSNDSAAVTFFRQIPRDSLVINEIMYEPSVSSCEWIELYNTSGLPISLWKTFLRVGERTPRTFAIDPEVIIPSRTYAIIAADSLVYNPYPSLGGQNGIVTLSKSTLDLSNDSSTIIFASYDSSVVDSVHYFSSWHTMHSPIHTGLSLERIDSSKSANDPRNWHTSTDFLGATPLTKNSGKAPNDSVGILSTSMQFSPNPFSPDGDGFEDQSLLTITSGDDLDYLMRVRLFEGRGIQVRTLADAAPFKISSAVVFDGKNDRGQTLSPGLYAALIELSSQTPPRVISKTIGVVIAGKRR